MNSSLRAALSKVKTLRPDKLVLLKTTRNWTKPCNVSNKNAPILEHIGREIHTSSSYRHGEYEMKDPEREEDVVRFTVINKDGTKTQVRGKVGDNLLYLSKRFDIAMEGACEASLACTTCHTYVDHDFLDTFPEPTETEEDLLDGAPFLRDNSRLGCQLVLQKEHNGLVIKLPAATKNFYVDGHKPTAH